MDETGFVNPINKMMNQISGIQGSNQNNLPSNKTQMNNQQNDPNNICENSLLDLSQNSQMLSNSNQMNQFNMMSQINNQNPIGNMKNTGMGNNSQNIMNNTQKSIGNSGIINLYLIKVNLEIKIL